MFTKEMYNRIKEHKNLMYKVGKASSYNATDIKALLDIMPLIKSDMEAYLEFKATNPLDECDVVMHTNTGKCYLLKSTNFKINEKGVAEWIDCKVADKECNTITIPIRDLVPYDKVSKLLYKKDIK